MSGRDDAGDVRRLQPLSAREEVRRLEAVAKEEHRHPLFDEWRHVVSEAHDRYGYDFGKRLEDAISKVQQFTERQVLDRVVIGLVDLEGVYLEELRMTHRTEFVPSLGQLTPNAEAAAEANFLDGARPKRLEFVARAPKDEGAKTPAPDHRPQVDA